MPARIVFAAIAAFLLGALAIWTQRNSDAMQDRFVTWQSSALDAQASIWLVNKYLQPEGAVQVRPQGVVVRDGIGFAFEGADHARTANHSAFFALLENFDLQDPTLKAMAQLVDDIEIAPWRKTPSDAAMVIEQAYRRLQVARSDAPASGCYAVFFDAAYRYLDDPDALADRDLVASSLADASCQRAPSGPNKKQPAEYGIAYVLQQIAQGRRVVFVDVREAREYSEGHIPGARHLRLRDIDEQVVAELKNSDLVLPYCIKDFRGYEVAKLLADNGVWPVGTMAPHGLAGWRSLGLPLASPTGLDDEAGVAAIVACATGQASCQL